MIATAALGTTPTGAVGRQQLDDGGRHPPHLEVELDHLAGAEVGLARRPASSVWGWKACTRRAAPAGTGML